MVSRFFIDRDYALFCLIGWGLRYFCSCSSDDKECLGSVQFLNDGRLLKANLSGVDVRPARPSILALAMAYRAAIPTANDASASCCAQPLTITTAAGSPTAQSAQAAAGRRCGGAAAQTASVGGGSSVFRWDGLGATDRSAANTPTVLLEHMVKTKSITEHMVKLKTS